MPPEGVDTGRANEPGCAPGGKRLHCFDGLRGALATYVALSHAVPFAAIPAWVATLFSHGGAAVDLFFSLSGFVIARSWESHDGRPGPFLAARARRIYPAYLAALLVAVPIQLIPLPGEGLHWATPEAWRIWSGGWPEDGWLVLALHVVMAHGLVPEGIVPDGWVGWLGAAWSLSTEWQFYGLVALAGGCLGRGRRFVFRLTLLLLCLAAAGFAYSRTAPAVWLFSRAFLPEKAVYFALGVAGAAAFRQRFGFWWLVFLVFAVCLPFDTRGSIGKALPPLAWAVCVAIQRWPDAPVLRFPARLLASRPATRLGTLSFSLYLVNEPVQKVFGVGLARSAGEDAALFTLIWLPASIFLPLFAALVLHRTIEQPFRRRRSRARVTVGLHEQRAGVAQW